MTLHCGITAHFFPRQGPVPVLLPNSQKTLLRERLTNVIRICPLTLCQNYSRSSCFSKGGTVDPIKLGRPGVSWNITLKKSVSTIRCRFRFMWRKHPNFVETGITLIRSLWPTGVPLHLDAVYQNVQKNFILFFKGKINKLKALISESYQRKCLQEILYITFTVLFFLFFSRSAILDVEAVRSSRGFPKKHLQPGLPLQGHVCGCSAPP